MCHWAVRLKTGKTHGDWVSIPWKDTAEWQHLHTHVNKHLFYHANSSHIRITRQPVHTPSRPHPQPPERGAAEQSLHDTLIGSFPWVSCNSEPQTSLHTMTEPHEITDARAGPSQPKSCINSGMISHWLPRSVIHNQQQYHTALFMPAVIIPGWVPDVIFWLTQNGIYIITV